MEKEGKKGWARQEGRAKGEGGFGKSIIRQLASRKQHTQNETRFIRAKAVRAGAERSGEGRLRSGVPLIAQLDLGTGEIDTVRALMRG